MSATKIQNAFSKSAGRYDHYAGLHREIAKKIMHRVMERPPAPHILDVGCGTVHLTAELKNNFRTSQVAGADFAPGMLQEARRRQEDITWVLADGCSLPFGDKKFDLVVSNLAYQWAGNLSQAFKEARRVLVPGGRLVCSLLGYHTCDELLQCLQEAGEGKLTFSRLPDGAKVQAAMQEAGFQDFRTSQEEITLGFQDMHALMGWIKSIGANQLRREGYIGPQDLGRAAFLYQKKFHLGQGIKATFEVIFIHAQK